MVLDHFAGANLTGMMGGPISKLFKEFHSMQNSGCHGNQKEKLKKSSCQKLLVRFQNNFIQMLLGWPSTKIVQIILKSDNSLVTIKPLVSLSMTSITTSGIYGKLYQKGCKRDQHLKVGLTLTSQIPFVCKNFAIYTGCCYGCHT